MMKIIFLYPFKNKLFSGPMKWLPAATAYLVAYLQTKFPDIVFRQLDIENIINEKIREGELPEKFYEIANTITTSKVDLPTSKEVMQYKVFFEQIISHCNLDKYDLYLFSLYGWNRRGLQANVWLAKYLKLKFGKDKKIVFGGNSKDKFLRNKKILAYLSGHEQNKVIDFVDSFVLNFWGGEATEQMLNELISGKKLQKIYSIPLLKREGTLQIHQRRRIKYIPEFSNFINLESFRYSISDVEKFYGTKLDNVDREEKVLFIPYLFSTGCFYRKCAYCPSSGSREKAVYKPPHQIIEDLKELKEKYSTNYFIFYNDNFNGDLSYAKKLLKSIIKAKLNILWTDSFNLCILDDELIDLLLQAGVFRVDVGVGTCDPSLQKLYHNLFRNKYWSNLEKISQKGIWTQVNLISNFPHQYSVKKDHEILSRYMHYIDSISYNNYLMYETSFLRAHYRDYNLSIFRRAIDNLSYDYINKDRGTVEIFFLENDFRGTLEERIQIFRKIFDDNIKFFTKYDVVLNEVNLCLLGLLYKNWGFKKEKIKNVVVGAWRKYRASKS